MRALVVFLTGYLAASAAAGEARREARTPPQEDETSDVCPVCKLPSARGMIACWGCGSRIGSPQENPKAIAFEIAPVRVISRESRSLQEDLSALSPEVALSGLERWIADNPNDFAGAIARMKGLLETVRGTSLEAVVEGRLKELSAAAAKAAAPKSPQERVAEAARAYTRVMEQVRREPDRILNNIKLLEELLKSVGGTPYEQLVRQQIERERAKASR